jgi:hypothetical protein
VLRTAAAAAAAAATTRSHSTHRERAQSCRFLSKNQARYFDNGYIAMSEEYCRAADRVE